MKQLDKKVNKYLDLNRGLRLKRSANTDTLLKQSLAMLSLPALTIGTAAAQCLGSLNGGAAQSIGNGQAIAFDVDGDSMNDFSIFVSAGTFLRIRSAGGGGQVFKSNGGYSASVQLFNTGNSIGGPFLGNNAFIAYSNGGQGAITGGATGTIGFQIGANRGFITLSVDYSSPNYQVAVLERGTSTQGGATAGDCSSLLPVELTHFYPKVVAQTIHLHWATASEDTNAGFELQRSTDAKEFQTIGFVAGAGTTQEPQQYNYEDKELSSGKTYYYRLKQIDFDGSFSYSQVVSGRLQGGKPTVSTFYPNPAAGRTQVKYTATNKITEVEVSVYNAAGQQLQHDLRPVSSGTNVLDFDFSTLGKGVFFVKFQADGDTHYQKLTLR